MVEPTRGATAAAVARPVPRVSTVFALFEAGATVDIGVLRGLGLVPKLVDTIKILGDGELTKKLTVKAHRASSAAKEKIAAAGATIEIVAG